MNLFKENDFIFHIMHVFQPSHSQTVNICIQLVHIPMTMLFIMLFQSPYCKLARIQYIFITVNLGSFVQMTFVFVFLLHIRFQNLERRLL